MTISPNTFLPVEIVFHPSWWNKHYGITFQDDFFFDPAQRVERERQMRGILHARFGDPSTSSGRSCEMGEANPAPKPIIGPIHIAAGWLPSAVLGCEIMFADDASPQVVPLNLDDDQAIALCAPDLATNPVFSRIIAMMDALEKEFGYLEGDLNWEGVLNVALNLRGPQIFVDMYENAHLAHHVLNVAYETVRDIALYVKRRTGTTSIAVNRGVRNINAPISLHPNCSVEMVSPQTFREFLLPYDKLLARDLSPYGIHHCGKDMHKVAAMYAEIKGAVFFDVGWGSDIRACRATLPDAIFSLRLSPVRVSTLSRAEVIADVERVLNAGAPLERAVVCCINMDGETPDENVRAIYETVERFRK
jgi:hypothetical protein